jgi:pantetheine-phosphate adenylyltransferase
MSVGLYPGSFDPFHLGHLDTVEQATRLFDEVVVAVLHNPAKSGWLSPERRVALIGLATERLPTVRAVHDDGLTIDLARRLGADRIVRSLARDVGGELAMAGANEVSGAIETTFVTPRAEVAGISSTVVRGLLDAGRHDAVVGLLSPAVLDELLGAPAHG